MEIEGLRSFLYAARLGNFTRAAEALYVTQPTLSRRIAALEDELGVQLFNRERGGITLTYAGTMLLREAEIIVARADALPSLISQEPRQEEIETTLVGTVHVGAQEMLDDYYVRAFMENMMERYPGLNLQVRREYPPTLRHALSCGNCDIAFFLRPVSSSTSQMLTRKVAESRIQLMVHDHHPFARRKSVDIHELVGENVIMLDRRVSPETVDFINGCCFNAGFSLNAVRYVSDIENGAILVSAGKGVSFAYSMMRFAQPLESVGVRLVDISGADMSIDYVARLRTDLSDDIRDAILDVLDTMAR